MNPEKRFSFKNITVFPLGKIISGLRLKEGDNMPVMNLCERYEAALKAGKHAFQLCEQFTGELSNIANTEVLRSVVKRCNKILKENERDLANMKAVQSLYESNLSYIAENIEQKLSVYLTDKSEKNRNDLHEAMSVFAGNKMVNSVLENLSYDEYETKHGKELRNLKAVSVKEEKTYTEEEVNQLISERMKEIENKQPEKTGSGSFREIDTHIELNSTIKKILENCGTNKKLAVFCMNYYNELNRGISEEALYESFISGISNWNYMPAVETEISAMRSRTEKYKQEIDLKKILEAMAQTGSYYIVPLIEECVLDYVNAKTLQNKAILKQRLVPFEFDPFVRDIENILVYDLSIPNTVYLGESVEKKNGYVHTDMVFSPVLYVKENESVFNVRGMYYVKKGNSISRLPKRDIPMLPESFTRICRYINSPDVEIINETNEIKVYSGKDVAVISEGAIKLNGKKVTTSELSGLYENYNIMGDEKAGFYKKIKDLNESFNDIAYIDFVKHVALNEDANHYVDVFRVKNNIFVTTVDKVNGVSTFYKNVNPIQCRKYINEHMGLNIGEIFEDILPSQETVKKMIVEKRALYEEYIDELHKKKEELDALNSDPETLDADKKAIADALDIVNDEIGKADNDYKDYLSDTDKYLNGDPADVDNSIDAESGEYKEDEPTESPEEMSTPIEDEPVTEDPLVDTPVDDVISVGSEPAIDTTGATDFDGLLDTPAKTEEGEDSYKIVDVRYNYNVKADKTENKGELIVIIPTVDMNGDIRNEMKRITFYLDEEGKPVINNEYMPLDMYKTIINAIVSNPKTAEVIDSMKNGSIAHRSADPVADTNTTEPVAATATLVASVENHDDDPDNDPDNDPNGDTDFDVNDEDFDKFLNDLNLDSDGEPDEEPAAESKAETPAEDSVPVEPVKQESPEDQREAGDAPAYPINVPLNIEDINPISKEDFEGDLDKAGIKHTQSEDNSSDICFTITDKSQVRWLKNYFKEWKGYSDVEFNSFFPELKNCMENKGSVPTMKLESIMLPYTEDYANMFHVNSIEKNPAAIKLIFESAQDKDFAYKSLKKYAKSHELDEDARLFVEKYEADQINESSLIKVPYSSFLHQKMSAMAYPTEVLGESLYITVNGKNAKKASVIFESFYKDEMPASVKSFVNDVKLNENIEITIKDDNGKSVTLNVDDVLNGKKEEKAEGSESPDETFDPDKSFEQVTTFSDDNMSPFGGPKDEDADDEDEKDDEKKGKKDDDKQKNEEEEVKPVEGEEDDEKKEEEKPEEEEEKKEEKKPKKHIVIKSKKKNESLEVTDFVDELLTESAKPTVMDNVKLSDGRRGQIIFQMANGNFIVNVAGRTVECAQNSVSMVTPRPDTVECPYKFDPNTLKALYEQYVKCGMFMNGMKMTPDDCKMKYFDYLNTADDDKVTVLVENQKLSIDRKYMRILEDVNNFANIAEYEKLSDKYYYNKKDFSLAESVGNMGKPVRVLADTGDKWELLSVPANTLKS